ncbi:MAG: amidase family protein, partial [Rhodospirillales bacterium]
FRMSGVREAAGSFDLLGLFARSIDDISLVRDVLLRRPVKPVGAAPESAPRIGFCRTSLWDRFEPAMRDALENTASQLSAAGATVIDFEFPAAFDRLEDAHRWVSSFEFARNFTHEYENHHDMISQRLRDGRIADGMGCSFETYRDSWAYLADCRAALPDLFGDIDFLITPSAFGEATTGLETTGPTQIGSIFTPLYLPCLSLPVYTGPSGLPMGLQLLCLPDRDEQLFRQARWVEDRLSR